MFVLMAAGLANASLITLDLEVTGGSTTISAVGQTVTMTVYALLPSTADSIGEVDYGFTSDESGTTMGDLGSVSQISVAAATVGGTTQYDSNTDAEWGGSSGSQDGWIVNGYSPNPSGTKIALATIVWTCTSLVDKSGDTIVINPISAIYDGTTVYDDVTIDGTEYNYRSDNGLSTSDYGYTGVTLSVQVPEPSTLILLSLAALGLLVYRRK